MPIFGEHEARFSIATGAVIGGRFPAPQRRLVQRWILRYSAELTAAWNMIRADVTPERIPSLDADNDN